MTTMTTMTRDEEYIRTYADDILRYCVAMTENMEEAQEAFMEVFANALVHAQEDGYPTEEELYEITQDVTSAYSIRYTQRA